MSPIFHHSYILRRGVLLCQIVRNLGGMYGTQSKENYINSVSTFVFLELHLISHSLLFWTAASMKKLMFAFVLSRLGYCNFLFVGRHRCLDACFRHFEEIDTTLLVLPSTSFVCSHCDLFSNSGDIGLLGGIHTAETIRSLFFFLNINHICSLACLWTPRGLPWSWFWESWSSNFNWFRKLRTILN